jgi:hypothetical protein
MECLSTEIYCLLLAVLITRIQLTAVNYNLQTLYEMYVCRPVVKNVDGLDPSIISAISVFQLLLHRRMS